MTDKILQSILVVLAGIGVWHLATVWLRREAKLRTFESWAAELYALAHELIDADMRVAQCEVRLMALIRDVPAETSYQVIRRIGLGRQMEAAILLKLEELGLGERLPPMESLSASIAQQGGTESLSGSIARQGIKEQAVVTPFSRRQPK